MKSVDQVGSGASGTATPWLPACACSQSDRLTCHWHAPCRSSLAPIRCSYKNPAHTLRLPDGITTRLYAQASPRTPSHAQKPASLRTHGVQAAKHAGGQRKFPPSTGYPQEKSTGYPPLIFMLHCYFLARLSLGARTFPYRNGSQDTGRGAKVSVASGREGRISVRVGTPRGSGTSADRRLSLDMKRSRCRKGRSGLWKISGSEAAVAVH